jgi:hypothetical protein
MRTLLLCVFFLGCKSPAVYEIIEVKHGETMQHLHRWNRGVRGRIDLQLLEVRALSASADEANVFEMRNDY